MKTLEERFWPKVQKTEGCWLWTATTRSGYGRFGQKSAHRFAYELLVGPIPEGLELDHLCHTNDPACLGGLTCVHRRCVNPAHLEPVTHAENIARGKAGHHHALKDGCPHGHPYDDKNTFIDLRGSRNCRTCARDAKRALRASQRLGS